MENNKKKKVLLVALVGIFLITIGMTYAFISTVITGTKRVTITAGTLSLVLDEKNEITISDALPMYDAVGMIQEEVFNFDLINNTSNQTEYILKLSKISTDNELSTSDVKYYLTKDGVGEPALLSTLTDGVIDTGTINGSQTIAYTLRLWIDSNVTDQSTITGKSLSYKLVLEASMIEELAYATNTGELVSDTTQLGENCKTYDDGTDTFLVGQCSQNYVWYSGKLWRVVLKNNETGAVKMVTDNAITAIPYNQSSNNTSTDYTKFLNSYADQWLTQEFLATLHNYEDYLVVDSVWDATASTTYTARPSYTTTVTRTVGLLNAYEYYTTYNNSDGLASYSTGYLKNKVEWWLMTPHTDGLPVHCVDYKGNLSYNTPNNENGVRPSVNLKSSVVIFGGTGTQSDPYILEGDLQEPTNGATLLNTRYSGEYITFNNELYRIVDVENGLTKITALDKPSELASNIFDSNDSISFASASIKTDLESYYQSLATSNEEAYNMIESSTTWYLGEVSDGVNYKASICATVDVSISARTCSRTTSTATASIGLPRLGEMFSSLITRGTKSRFWLLTPYSEGSVRYIVDDYDYRGFDGPDYDHGARPSMYLKSNVVIASDNTGNGTYEYPYSIELGA